MLMSGMMAMPFIGGVKVYADFEQQMANVSTMLSEPERHMPGFRDSIRDEYYLIGRRVNNFIPDPQPS